MSTAVIPVDQQSLYISQADADFMPVMQITRAIERYNMVLQFTQQIMKAGKDFGEIPGTDKPTLLKPGAEKLCSFFGLTPRFTIVEKVESWEGQEPFFYYWYKCQLLRGERVIGEGEGSANSRESKHRYRWVGASQLPPGADPAKFESRDGAIVEMDFAITKAETAGKYGKPLTYWQAFKDAITAGTAERTQKDTRNGPKLAWKIGAPVYRVPNPDIADQVNTLQKMSQKRSFIAATLIACNASEYYTQDIEDMVDVTPQREPEPATAHHEPPADQAAPVVPVELQGAMERIRKAKNVGEQIRIEMTKICDLMTERAGSHGNEEYNRLAEAFRIAHPDPKKWRPSLIDQLLCDAWAAYQALPTPEPAAEQTSA
jgi:hypothetical protein